MSNPNFTALLLLLSGVAAPGLGSGIDPTRNAQLVSGLDGLPGAPAEQELFGTALAAGDFNGDGRDDLAVGVPGRVVLDIVGTGQVLVTYGAEGGLGADGLQTFAVADFGIGNAQLDERFGTAVAAGDFDNDGFDDLAIGIPWRSHLPMGGAAAWRCGYVVVLPGSEAGLDLGEAQVLRQGLDGLAGVAETDDHFGRSLETGDFDSDGYTDLVVGVPDQNGAAAADTGSVVVIRGTANGLAPGLSAVWTQTSVGLDGEWNGDRFGALFAAADWNNDSYPDLAIGTPFDEVQGAPMAGSVTVLYGSAAGLTNAGAQRLTELGAVPGSFGAEDLFGRSLAAADFDGDGTDDLAVGVPGEDLTAPVVANAGAVVLLSGSPAGLELDGIAINRNTTGTAAGPTDFFGAALAVARFGPTAPPALIVGIPGATVGGEVAGAAVVVESPTGSAQVSATLAQGLDAPGVAEAGDQFGSVFEVGDFDGDGAQDLAVGVPLDHAPGASFAGSVQLYYGSAGLFADGFESGDTAAWSATVE